MEMLWSVHVLLVVISVDVVHSHNGSEGLSCVNDFINNVSCTWISSQKAPDEDCWIFGVKKTWILENNVDVRRQMKRSCKLNRHRNSPPGCSFVFENEEFNSAVTLPSIHMECNGKLVENITDYKPIHHIKMHPPSAPRVNRTANETWITWSPGSPVSYFFKNFNFQVQIKQTHQMWKEVSLLPTPDLELRRPSNILTGHRQVRVRVRPPKIYKYVHWSDWSPTTSWVGPVDVEEKSQEEDCNVGSEWPLDRTSLIIWGVLFSFSLVLVVVLVHYRRCLNRRFHKRRPVPNPSKYFHTFHSVHGGNLKSWLNPLSSPPSFFTVQPCNHISPVQVCESWDVPPSTSPSSSSTSALLHPKSYPSAGSDTSGVIDNCSSSSSCFSNMGYFMSSSSSSSAGTGRNPAYLIYKDDIPKLCLSLTNSAPYESLKREPQSPDSGFGIGKEDEDEDKEDIKVVDVEGERASDDHQSTPLLTLPLHPPPQMCPPCPPPPPNAPSLSEVSPDGQQMDTPVAPASGSYSAWPLAGAMSRSSSMPVEPCKTGYLTLKELQTTFSNKSI